MYSVVECGGFQFKVSEGDVITVPRMEADKDSEVTLDRVLLTGGEDTTTVGQPLVEGASVKAKVLEHGRGKKVMVMKLKRRKDYRRRNGHRQDYTTLRITSVGG